MHCDSRLQVHMSSEGHGAIAPLKYCSWVVPLGFGPLLHDEILARWKASKDGFGLSSW